MKREDIVDNITVFLHKFTSHPQGAPLEHILHIRVASSHRNGRRVGLPIYGHKFIFPELKSTSTTTATTITTTTTTANNNKNEEVSNATKTVTIATIVNTEGQVTKQSHS